MLSYIYITKVNGQRANTCKYLLILRGKFGAMNDVSLAAPGSVGITIKHPQTLGTYDVLK